MDLNQSLKLRHGWYETFCKKTVSVSEQQPSTTTVDHQFRAHCHCGSLRYRCCQMPPRLPENMVFRAVLPSSNFDDEQNRLSSENCLVGFSTLTFDSFLKYFSYLSIQQLWYTIKSSAGSLVTLEFLIREVSIFCYTSC